MEKVWLKNYEEGVVHEINPDEYRSLPEVFEEAFKKFSSLPAFHNMGKTITYADLDNDSKKFASFLQNELNLKHGDRVALMMPNILQYPIAFFGILRAGMVVVNVNPLYTARELEHQMKDSGADAIVIYANAAHTLESVIDKTGLKHVIVTEIGDLLKFPKSAIVNFVLKNVKKMVPPFNLPNSLTFKDALAKGDPSTYRPVAIKSEDLAVLQYTGGTTGVAKGAMLTHRNIISNVLQARNWIKNLVTEGKEIVITPLPLYHIFSLTANCIVFSSLGGLNILITNPRDIPGFVKELRKWQFTALTGVNTLFNALLNNEEFDELDFSHFKCALGGGMAVQKPVAEKWKEVTKVPLIEAYGLSETSPAACMNPMNIPEYNGFIGLPISSTVVSIRDDDENELSFGEPGEICIYGPQVMKGYWNRPDETKKTMTADGYLKTGDVGVMNEDGFIKLVDRKKDMILVSGFNVYPNEIEDVVAGHPKVLECAAIGVPDKKSGEAVKLFVVKKEADLTADELKAFCKKELTGYKIPKHVEFREELPKTNVGKILRKDLREPAA